MKTSCSVLLLKVISCLALTVALTATSHAAVGAPIMWSAPASIGADTDVILGGVVVGAFNLGAVGVSGTTVNGVTFAPFVVSGIGGSSLGSFGSSFSLGGTTTFFPDNTALGSASPPFSTLSPSYKTLLASGEFTASGSQTLTMSGLTPGQMYFFEWWCNDSGLLPMGMKPAASTTATAVGPTSVTLSDNTTFGSGGLGQFAFGTFTAPMGGVESIDFTGPTFGISTINAFQLRTIPEPSALALVGLGLAGLLGWRRFKR